MKNLKNMDLQEMSKSEMEKFNGGEGMNVEGAIISGVMGMVTATISVPVMAICPPLGAVIGIAGLAAILGPAYYTIVRHIASKF